MEEELINNLILKKIKKEDLKENELKKILVFLYNKYYYDNISYIKDQDYDILDEYYKNKYKKDFIDTNNDELPEKFNKIDRFYDIDKKFFKKIEKTFENQKNIIITSKLDGVGGLLIKKNNILNFYTKGNMKNGKNINHLIKKINFPFDILPNNITLQGELILKKNNNENNLRSKISGLINKKKNDDDLELINFVVFKVILYKNNFKEDMTFVKQIEFLNKNKIPYPYYKIYNKEEFYTLNIEDLFLEFKNNEKYEIDGIMFYNLEDDKNIAYKKNLFFKDVVIKEIEWKINDKRIYIPVLKFEPVEINNVICKKVSGFNINFLIKNQIGINSVIEIVYKGNSVPIINKIIKTSTNITYPEKYEWTENNLNIYRKDEDLDSISKKIEKVYLEYKIKGIKQKTIKKVLIYFLDRKVVITNIFKFIYFLNKLFRLFEKKKKTNITIVNVEKDAILKKSLEIFKNKKIIITKILHSTGYFENIGFELLKKMINCDTEFIRNFKKNNHIDYNDEKMHKIFKLEKVGEKTVKNFINGIKKYEINRHLFERYFKIDYLLKKIKIIFINVSKKKRFEEFDCYLEIYNNIDEDLDFIITDDKETIKNKKYKIKIMESDIFYKKLKKIFV